MKTTHLHQQHYFSIFDYLSKLFRNNSPSIKESKSKDVKLLAAKANQGLKTPLRNPLSTEEKIPDTSPTDFLNSIIHELKNPLNVIIGFSEILRDEDNYKVSPEERAEYLKDINESANDLNDLVHDILEVNSGTSGNFSVDLSKEIDVKNLIKRSVKLNYDYSLTRGITIKTEIAEDLSTIKLDTKRMKQILANLISNSIKYSPEKTEIKISAKNIFEDEQKYLQIMIIDQGFGMTKEQIQLAFQKYKTFQNPNSGKVDSFGLGLPIVKHLVELQRGTIVIESEIERGTKMIVKFPYIS
ncbi:MAG: sensor histidine kinase [Proteobacteria bacterium]|nr:sensor histidine kinase [Pseudomonadota bacterium]